MKIAALIILIAWPIFQFGVGIAKEVYQKQSKDEKHSGIFAGIFVTSLTYTVYYFAGIFEMLIAVL